MFSCVLVVAVASFSAPCFACSCEANLRTCNHLHADAIFVGTVVELVPVKHVFDGESWPGYSMRLSVERSLKGNLGGEVSVETGSGGGDCGTPLPPGDRYLIFAYKNTDTKLWTGSCNGDQKLKSDADVVAAIEPIQTAITPGKGSLYGLVTYTAPVVWDKNGKPVGGGTRAVPGLLMKATSETNTFTTFTGKNGNYEFKNLKNGHYTITPDLQPDWAYDQHFSAERYERSVADGSCAKIDFPLQQTTRLQARVTLAPGEQFGVPPDGTFGLQTAVAIPVGLEKTNDRSGIKATIEPDGYFDLWPIPPGDYYVGINISTSPTPQAPFVPTYYPGVTDKNAARVVHLDEGESKYIEFPPPEFASKRMVHLVAIGSDGKPLPKVRATLEDLQHPGNMFDDMVDVDLDANGAGTMDIYAGVAYHLHASYIWLPRTTWCASTVLVPAGSKPVDARFVMDRSDSFEKRQAEGRFDDNCSIGMVDRESNSAAKANP